MAALFSPNLPALMLFVGGWVIELFMLARMPDSIYRTEGHTPVVAVTFLGWFWLTLMWALWWAGQKIRRRTLRWLWITIVAVASVVYVASWLLYLQSGRFLNWEALRFTFGNFNVLSLYLRQSERATLWKWGVLSVGTMMLLVAFLRQMGRARWGVEPSEGLNRGRRLVWYSFSLAWLTLGISGQPHDLAVIARREDSLRNCLNPTVTLLSSAWASLSDESVEANLDTSTLVPLDQKGWWSGHVGVSNRQNVVFVTIESMRHDVVLLQHQGREVTPNINELAHAGVLWTHAYAQATHTDYSTVSLFSSTFPLRARRHVYFRPTDPWPKTLIYEVLKAAGYATAMVSSQNEGWGGMDHFLASSGLDLFYDPKHAGSVRRAGATSWADNFADAQTADRAAMWMREQAVAGHPFFLAVNFQSSHFPYQLPPGCETPFQPGTVDFPVAFLEYPEDKTEIMRNAYFNALHECDRQLGRLVETLRETGQFTNTIIFVCGDHGQAFHEHGYVTHAREPIEPVIRTASVLCAPQLVAPHVDDYPVELVDITPTVLALLGLTRHPNFQGIDVLSSHRPPPQERLLFFHTENALTRTDAVLLAGRWKYWLNRESKQESLFDLATDPGEQEDVIKAHPLLAKELGQVLHEWRQRQLAYYAFPQYYQYYYPPAPPTVTRPDSARGDR